MRLYAINVSKQLFISVPLFLMFENIIAQSCDEGAFMSLDLTVCLQTIGSGSPLLKPQEKAHRRKEFAAN